MQSQLNKSSFSAAEASAAASISGQQQQEAAKPKPSNVTQSATLVSNILLLNSTQLVAADRSLNGSQLSSSQQDEDTDMLAIRIIMMANVIICFVGLCGNAVVILVIFRFTRHESVTDIYILNLAFADLMFIMGLIFLIITMQYGYWIFGNVMCKVRHLNLHYQSIQQVD